MRTVASVIVFAGAIAGCTASAEDVRPPPDQLSFPTGLAVSPDETALFVVNANSELRYDSGSVGVIDLTVVENVLGQWLAATPTLPDGCSQDPDHTETLVCDEAPFFKKDAGIRVGNFATDLAVQNFTDASGNTSNLRLFIPTRGDPSIAWADYDGTRLSCNATSETYALCDDAHRLTSLDNNPDLTVLPNEPFGVFAHVDPAVDDQGHPVAPSNGFAMITHLGTGSVTLINAPADSTQVQIVDMISNVFAPDLVTTGLRGASGIAGLAMPAVPPQAGASGPPPVSEEMVYVASNSEDRVQTFNVGRQDVGGGAGYLLPGSFFFLDAVGSGAGSSNDTRGISFSSSGDQLYLVNRTPPSLQVYDTSIGPTGVPVNRPLGSSDLCREASGVSVLDPGAVPVGMVPPAGQLPIGDRVYVTCFQDGQVYVVDPTGQSQVEDIISVGRAPYAVVAVGKNSPSRKRLFVSNFLEDTIAVIDLSLDSPKRNRVVLRIGTPRAQ